MQGKKFEQVLFTNQIVCLTCTSYCPPKQIMHNVKARENKFDAHENCPAPHPPSPKKHTSIQATEKQKNWPYCMRVQSNRTVSFSVFQLLVSQIFLIRSTRIRLLCFVRWPFLKFKGFTSIHFISVITVETSVMLQDRLIKSKLY